MGGISTKEEIIARLDYLDREEIKINKELRELQIELNGIVPVKDRVKVKKEYFDNISFDESGKIKESDEEVDIENLDDLEEEEEMPKRKKKKKPKVKFDKEDKKVKKKKK
jgi:hypothetical protein